jgi:hypothetical protein
MDTPLRKIELRGNPRERGRIHGETLRPLVREHLDRWQAALVADLGVEPDAYVEQFLRDTRFLPAIERWTPGLLEELRGIADGAGTDFRYTFVRALSDEEPWYRRERKLAAMTAKGCTSLGADACAGRPTLIAQNMDMPRWCDGHQVLLHVIDPLSPVEVFAFTIAGKISLCGMNSAGLGMCCNTLSQLNYARDVLPEDFVVRGFLERASLAEGLEFLRTVPHASGQNYTVAGPGSPAINLECSTGAVVEFRPPQCGDRVYHTNHPIVSRDQDTFFSVAAGLPAEQLEQLYYGTSYPRLAALERSFGDPTTSPTVEGMKAVLSSHQGPVCRHGEREGRHDHFTLGCLVMELGASPRLHVAPGPPCRTAFQVFSFAQE